jgi:hypothetical protein
VTNIRLVVSRNGGPIKVAEWVPERDSWRIEGRADLIDRERFAGNYKVLKEKRRG